MKFVHMDAGDIEKQIRQLKALERLTDSTYTRRELAPGSKLSFEQQRAASVLQYAPLSSAFNYLNKGTVEHIQGEYLSREDMLVAARALGLREKDGSLNTSKGFIRALENVVSSGMVLEFDPAQEKARTV